VFVNELLTGIGRRLFQRLMVIFVIAVVLRSIGFFMGPGDDGTFRSTSSEMRAGPAPSAPGEDSGWGTSTSKSERRRSDRDRDGSGTPVYDPGEDGGWGSN
jgi:hypothetical protein